MNNRLKPPLQHNFVHFASAVVAVVFSQLSTSSSTLWSLLCTLAVTTEAEAGVTIYGQS